MSYETWILLVPVAMFDIVLFNSFCMLLTKQFLYIYVFIFIENAKETRRIEFLLSGKSCLRRIAVILLLTTKFRSFTFLFFLCVEISQEKTVFFLQADIMHSNICYGIVLPKCEKKNHPGSDIGALQHRTQLEQIYLKKRKKRVHQFNYA